MSASVIVIYSQQSAVSRQQFEQFLDCVVTFINNDIKTIF